MPSIENLSSALANTAAQDAYQQSITSRGDLDQLIDALDAGDASALPPMDKTIPPELGMEAMVQNSAITQTEQSSTKVNPGTEILHALQKTSDSHSESVQNLVAATESLKGKNTVSNADLVNLQMAMMDFQLKNDLISKASGSVSQGLQTLFRNQ